MPWWLYDCSTCFDMSLMNIIWRWNFICPEKILKAFKKALKYYRRIFFDWVLLYNMAKLISEKVSFNNFNNVFPTPFLHPILICFSDKTCLKKRAPSSMVLESQDSTYYLGISQWFIISKIGHLFFSIFISLCKYIFSFISGSFILRL